MGLYAKELAEIRARKKEIRALLKSDVPTEKLDLDAIEAELDNLEQRQMEIEGQVETVAAIRAGSTVGLRTVATFRREDPKGGDTRMAYANEIEERRASPEYREVFLRYLMGQDVERRALITTTTGAVMIPTSVFNQVIEGTRKAGGLLSLARILQVPGNLTIPQAGVQQPAAWHTQGEEIADSNSPPGGVTLTGYELVKLFSMSAATQSMSIAAFESYLLEELMRCTRDALADALVNGTGTGQPKGILNGFTWDATNSVAIAADGDAWDGLADAFALLPSNFAPGSVVATSTAELFGYWAKVKSTDGVPLLVRDTSEGMPMRLMGKPVVIDDYIPAKTTIVGNPGFYYFNFSQPIALEVSRDAGFTTATIVYRSLAVVDGAPVAPAFIKITRA